MKIPPALQKILIYAEKWLRPPRTLRITKGGWQFLGLTVIVGVAALNTGNNLLYLVFGLMLSFITASGVLSELMLRKVRITRNFPRHIFAQQAVPVSITVTNRKKYISSFSLLIEDFSQDNYAEHSRYILKISARGSETITYPVTFVQRGLHRPGKIRLSTRYPFGFFLKSTTFVEIDENVLVYPAIEKLPPSEIPNRTVHTGEFQSSRKGSGLDVHGIRDYVRGDGSTRIHWKSTAKLAKLMTKEFEEEQKKKISVLLDISLPGAKVPVSFYQDVERAISLAASYILHFVKSNFQIQLITPTEKSKFDYGQRHLFRLLRMLALLQPTNGHSHQNFAKLAHTLNRAETMKILISANDLSDYKQGSFSKVVNINTLQR